MQFKYFVMLNLLCMAVVGYFSWHLGLAWCKSSCMQDYFKTTQAEAKIVLETSQLIQCESGNKDEIWGDGGRAYGRFQFHKTTFYNFVKEANLEDLNLDWKNPEHQFRIWKWAYNNGKLNHWTCYRSVEF